ncbi:MAG: hypothetical protein IJJ26_11110 [Victivallales bacterium]|nr:hypothetical protein [Victivallales bacterium]
MSNHLSTELILFLIAFSITICADIVPIDSHTSITEKDLCVELSTDKKKYFLGEPVILILKVKNLTARHLNMARDSHFIYEIKLTASKETFLEPNTILDEKGQVILDDTGFPKLIHVEKTYDACEPPRTTHRKQVDREGLLHCRGFDLPPHGEYTTSIPLNALYDITSHPKFIFPHKTANFDVEFNYPVQGDENKPWVVSFYVKTKTTFEVEPYYTSASRMRNENLERLFGKDRACKLLLDETETVIRKLREHPELQNEETEEHKRMMTLLASLSDFFRHPERLVDLKLRNKTSLDDFEELVKECQRTYQSWHWGEKAAP